MTALLQAASTPHADAFDFDVGSLAEIFEGCIAEIVASGTTARASATEVANHNAYYSGLLSPESNSEDGSGTSTEPVALARQLTLQEDNWREVFQRQQAVQRQSIRLRWTSGMWVAGDDAVAATTNAIHGRMAEVAVQQALVAAALDSPSVQEQLMAWVGTISANLSVLPDNLGRFINSLNSELLLRLYRGGRHHPAARGLAIQAGFELVATLLRPDFRWTALRCLFLVAERSCPEILPWEVIRCIARIVLRDAIGTLTMRGCDAVPRG